MMSIGDNGGRTVGHATARFIVISCRFIGSHYGAVAAVEGDCHDVDWVGGSEVEPSVRGYDRLP